MYIQVLEEYGMTLMKTKYDYKMDNFLLKDVLKFTLLQAGELCVKIHFVVVKLTLSADS